MVVATKNETMEIRNDIDDKYGPSYGKSRSVSTLKVVRTAIRREFQILKRYKANLIGGFVQLFIFMLVFFLFAYAASFRNLELSSGDMFIFFLGGLSLIFFSDLALFQPIRTVNRELYNGTLEYVYGSPSSKYGYFVGGIIANMIINMIFFVPLLAILVYYAEPSLWSSLAIFASIVAVLAVFTSFGIMIATLGIMWKQTSSIVGILNLLFQFITGMFFPVTALPTWIQWVAKALPITYGLDLVRYYSFDGNWDTIYPVWLEWTLLFVFMVIYTFIAQYLLNRTERYAKNNGLHLI